MKPAFFVTRAINEDEETALKRLIKDIVGGFTFKSKSTLAVLFVRSNCRTVVSRYLAQFNYGKRRKKLYLPACGFVNTTVLIEEEK